MKKLIIWLGLSSLAFVFMSVILWTIIITWEIAGESLIDYLSRYTFLTSVVLTCVFCMLLIYREIREDSK